MRRRLALLVSAALLVAAPVAYAADRPLHSTLRDVDGLTVTMADSGAHLTWSATEPDATLQVLRDDASIATLPGTATSYDDSTVAPATTYGYRVVTTSSGAGRHLPAPVTVSLTTPGYKVGGATRDISPTGVINLGGFGLGDGSVIPDAIIGRGGRGEKKSETIRSRATVVDDGKNAIAIANIETQGYFAAYEDGPYGLRDMAARVSHDTGMPIGNILIAADHTHSGPDTIGVWGGVSDDYLRFIADQTVAAIDQAYADRKFARIVAGHSDASDLIYNQSCTEALNQSKTPDYPGPDVCATPGKDGMFRVLQATAPSGQVLLTFAAYAAHATAGGGDGVHGDWPQFLSDAMTTEYGGTGLAMVGALGGTQPCRTACSFTDPKNPGYNLDQRKAALVANYGAHVRDALAHAVPVSGPVRAAQGFIREAITGPAVTGLFTAGEYMGSGIYRNHESPWVNGQTIRTIASAIRIGNVAIVGTPGEGFPRIGQDVRDALGGSATEVIQLGLANDQLGYLIAPASYVPIIAAEVPVNDNIIFNVSPTIGDHVACADLRLALSLGFAGSSPAQCAPYDAADSLGDPVSSVPVGGIVLPKK